VRLDPKALGWAAGIAAMALFLVCALAVALAPESTAAVGGFLLHADLEGLVRTPTWTSFVGGLIGWGAFAALVFSLVAILYNRFGGARG
jgi:hypothetical protein